MGGQEGIEEGSGGNKKGAKGRGPHKLVYTPMFEILKIP